MLLCHIGRQVDTMTLVTSVSLDAGMSLMLGRSQLLAFTMCLSLT